MSQSSFSATTAFEFEYPAYTVNELDGSAIVIVGRSPATTGYVHVNCSTGGGTATAGLDYYPVHGTLGFST